MFCASDADSAVVELGGWRMGMLICYDVEFPENARKLALRGTDLIVAPTANAKPQTAFSGRTLPCVTKRRCGGHDRGYSG
jgi:predicted amidohydrolase